MENQKLAVNVSIQIAKSPAEVFEAIVDPEKMKNYFVSRSSGRMEAGKTLDWCFPEMDSHFPVRIEKAEQGRLVSFYWGNDQGGENLVEIALEAFGNDTIVKVSEQEADQNEAGIQWLAGNTEGWSYFLAGMKAYIEYGINLRKGAFDYRFVEK